MAKHTRRLTGINLSDNHQINCYLFHSAKKAMFWLVGLDHVTWRQFFHWIFEFFWREVFWLVGLDHVTWRLFFLEFLNILAGNDLIGRCEITWFTVPAATICYFCVCFWLLRWASGKSHTNGWFIELTCWPLVRTRSRVAPLQTSCYWLAAGRFHESDRRTASLLRFHGPREMEIGFHFFKKFAFLFLKEKLSESDRVLSF